MEARVVEEIPSGPQWQYEPKWDGFRCLAFRDGDDVYLQSKAGQPLARYFPEVVAAVKALRPKRFVIDGELVVPVEGSVDFEVLLLRIHPAASRVAMLAKAHPATYVIFDLLEVGEGDDVLTSLPTSERRERLERFAQTAFVDDRVRLSPASRERKIVDRWFGMVGGALDGIVAKRLDAAYASGERTAMIKVKRLRTADCVVGGFRYAAKGKGLGSILLGLYDEEERLHYVGFTSGFAGRAKEEVLEKLERLRGPSAFGAGGPGGPSRWKKREEDDWQPVKPKLVLAVRFDQTTGERFRHGTRPLRWRPDKAPQQCTLDQIAGAKGSPLELLR
ncbi:MAG: ATP-dependent DNA ligase [Candidatus Eremiobacteraeota bacterium]|nr:ATP-dependent DNA ligase [Candidatus Eremiobacteraeota bacterium]